MTATDWPTPRDLLERDGLLARKSLGQHFLLDLGITRRIAALAGDIAGKPVIEVGPGPGGLTRALLEAGADPLVVIEKDARFVELLRAYQRHAGSRLKIVDADALEVDEAALLAPHTSAPIVSNLPYNVGTPLLVKWLKAGTWRGAMTLMFQKEVADRVVAAAGSSAYGRLAVIAQARTHARIVMKLPPGAFTPPPKVASAVVRLVDRPDAYGDIDALERVTAAAFGQRRKMLRSSLAALAGVQTEALLERAAIAPTARAEEISVERFCALATAWRETSGAQTSSRSSRDT